MMCNHLQVLKAPRGSNRSTQGGLNSVGATCLLRQRHAEQLINATFINVKQVKPFVDTVA